MIILKLKLIIYFNKRDIIYCDTRNFSQLKKKLINFDFIINLVGQTGVLESDKDQLMHFTKHHWIFKCVKYFKK